MLTLPEQWRSWTSGAIVVNLMALASGQPFQTEVARHFILASLDLLQRRYAKRGGGPVRIVAVSELEWRVGDYLFAYVPAVNDDVVYRWVRAAHESSRMYLIVLPRHDRVLFHSLNALLGQSAPVVMGLDAYVDLRTLFTTMEFNWSRDRVNLELIEAYNRCAATSRASRSILIALSESSEGAQGG